MTHWSVERFQITSSKLERRSRLIEPKNSVERCILLNYILKNVEAFIRLVLVDNSLCNCLPQQYWHLAAKKLFKMFCKTYILLRAFGLRRRNWFCPDEVYFLVLKFFNLLIAILMGSQINTNFNRWSTSPQSASLYDGFGRAFHLAIKLVRF